MTRTTQPPGPPGEPWASEQSMTIGVLAYGSLINDPGRELAEATVKRVHAMTPFRIEFARSSTRRGGGPTLVPVQPGGAAVPAVVLVLDKSVSISSATDMLYRRETSQVEGDVNYVHTQDPGPDDVVVEQLKDFGSCDVVLYTNIRANIQPLTADNLAALAIASARGRAGAARRDGISYLIAAKKNGIVTALSPDYESQVLAKTNTDSLSAAWSACRKSVQSSQHVGKHGSAG